MEKRYTVLIVDDAEHNIELMSEMLKDSYNIITARGGEEALKIMRGENPPDVVLLDMLMPKPAFFDSPTLRSRWAMVLLSTVGTPPQTMTQKQ